MTDRQFSPVVMFVYAKPEHTRKTIESLAKNPEASSTDLFIYSDAAKVIRIPLLFVKCATLYPVYPASRVSVYTLGLKT